MSDYQTDIGRLKLLSKDKEEIKKFMKNNVKFINKGYTLEEQFADDYYDKYFLSNGYLFSVIEKDTLPFGDICKLTLEKNGTYSFIFQYYNGGAGFTCMLDEATKKLQE